MANNIIISVIFKKPYLKEFLIAYTGGEYPIVAKELNFIGKLLKSILEPAPKVRPMVELQQKFVTLKNELTKNPDNKTAIRQIEIVKNRINDYRNAATVNIVIPRYTYMKPESMNYISYENMNLFESLIHDLFSELFYTYVTAKIESGFLLTHSINSFCLKYDLPMNALTFELLKKKYYRYSKSVEIIKNDNKNIYKMSRVLSRRLNSFDFISKQMTVNS